MGPPRRHQGRSRVPQVGGAAPRCGQTSCASRRPWPAGRRAWAMSTHLALRPHSPPHAGDQETLQPHPGGDLPLQLAPPPDQQPHLLHRGAGKAPGTWAREGVALSPGHTSRQPPLCPQGPHPVSHVTETQAGACTPFPLSIWADGGPAVCLEPRTQAPLPWALGREGCRSGGWTGAGKRLPAAGLFQEPPLPTGVPPPARVRLPRQQPERRLLHQRQRHGQVPVLR